MEFQVSYSKQQNADISYNQTMSTEVDENEGAKVATHSPEQKTASANNELSGRLILRMYTRFM